MKMLKKLFALTLTVCMAAALFQTATVSAGENLLDNQSSNNFGMYAVPIPNEVNIDADFSEWDWSGRIMIFPDYDTLSAKGAEVAAMYDTDNLYLGFKVNDITPLNNTRDPVLEKSETWRGDSFQLRAIGDHCVWITTAYHKNSDQYSFFVVDMYGMTVKSGTQYSVMYYSKPGSTKLDQVLQTDAVKRPSYVEDLEICARIDTQNPGTYYYEIKMPFETVYNDTGKYPKAGDIMTLAFEIYWADETGYNIGSNYKDNLMAGTTSRDFFYQKDSIWGTLTFLAEGNIEPRQYIKDKASPMSGYLSVEIEVPKDRDFITVVAEDNRGNRIRNIVSEFEYKEYPEYIVGETDTSYTVKILWDGRDEYGSKVSPGEYIFKPVAYNRFDPVFDAVFYGPGQIPWSTTASSSGWLSDHTPPRTISAYGDEVYVGAAFAEGGHGLMAISAEDGSKKWGVTFGAGMLQANEKYIYTIPGWAWTQNMLISLNTILVRYDRLTGAYNNFVIDGEAQPLEVYMADILGVRNGESAPRVTAVAANNEVVAIATSDMTGTSGMDSTYYRTAMKYPSAVQILSGEDLTLKKRIYVDDVGQIEFTKDGTKLYGISGKNKIVEINIVTGKVEEVKLTGVDNSVEFSSITCDNDGNIVLFDKGEDVQGKAYNPETGKLVYTFGQKGGRPYDGIWEKQGLTKNVSDLAVDNTGAVWVTEDWNYPRRISKWSAEDGTLIQDWIGTTFYMAGGSGVDEDDPDLVYWGPVQMRLDRENNTYEVEKILYIPDPLKGELFPMDSGGNCLIQYMSSDASGEMHNYVFSSGVIYIETETGRYRPCFAIGQGTPTYSHYRITPDYDESKTEEYASVCGLPFAGEMAQHSKWMWNDYNMDGKIQENEVQFFPYTYNPVNTQTYVGSTLPIEFDWSGRMDKDLTFCAYYHTDNYTYNQAKFGIYKPVGFTEDGAPLYSAASDGLKIVEDPGVLGQASEVYYDKEDNTAICIPAQSKSSDPAAENIRCVDVESGELVWTYKNEYPGVAGSHSSGMQTDGGVIIGSLKIMGIYKNSNGDKFIHIRGNMGCDYILSMDGYYVSTMFQDNRLVRVSLPDTVEETKGKSLNYVSTGGEPFGGNGATQSDGKTRFILTTGGRCAVVCELTNMDTFVRLDPVKLTVTREDLDAAYAYVEETVREEAGENENQAVTLYEIKKATDGFTIDGDLSDWDGYPSLKVEVDGATENSNVKVAWNSENLFISFDTRDDSPMVNNGIDWIKLFKTGDVADIYLSPSGNKEDDPVDGDFRLTFSVFEGKEVAVLSVPVNSKASESDKTSYSSPVETRIYDTVRILTDAEIGIIRTDTGYALEARIPFSSLNMTPDTSKTMTGDVGIIKGDPEGTVNLARIYYFNKQTGLTSDLPGEAKLWPSRWGSMKFSDTDPRIEE